MNSSEKKAGKLLKKGKRPLLAALDVYRPGAIKQLQVNGEKVGVPVFTLEGSKEPVKIAEAALAHAEQYHNDVLFLDTAGRLQIDEDMMQELEDIKKAVTVHQTLLVVDAMTGQEAVNVAQTFNDRIGVDGVILSKMDGDTRGGAALSVKAVTGKPILYVGMGEKLSDLEQFYPDRMASRILGMGDVLTLIDKVQENMGEEDEKANAEMSAKIKKGKFDFNDYLESMKQMRKMGGMGSVLKMMPNLGLSADEIESAIDEKKMARMEAIVLSMTPAERANPKLLTPQRKYRIAKGSGNDIADVNRFIKQFKQMQEMVKKMPGMMGKPRHGNPFGMMGMGRRGNGNPFAGGRGGFPF